MFECSLKSDNNNGHYLKAYGQLNAYVGRITRYVTLRLAISLSVLVSSPLWYSWPNIGSRLTLTVLSMWGALFDERSDQSPVSHCQQHYVHCQNLTLFIFYMSLMCHVCALYTRPPSVQANSLCVKRTMLFRSIGTAGRPKRVSAHMSRAGHEL
jgi:hypothetical protein